MVTLRNSILGTVIFLNLVLIVFLWERQAVFIQKDVPTIAKIKPVPSKSEILSELVGVSRHGDYIVENYRQVQVWYDQKGHVLKRIPTGDHTYLRYWTSKKGKVITDDTNTD